MAVQHCSALHVPGSPLNAVVLVRGKGKDIEWIVCAFVWRAFGVCMCLCWPLLASALRLHTREETCEKAPTEQHAGSLRAVGGGGGGGGGGGAGPPPPPPPPRLLKRVRSQALVGSGAYQRRAGIPEQHTCASEAQP